MISQSDDRYPILLRETAGAPKRLWARGKLPGDTPSVSIVGTRKARPRGLSLAREVAAELVRAGFWVISGLALGVDAAAHEGALSVTQKGAGKTIGVLGSGLHKIYPRQNLRLAERMLNAGGGLLSEYEPDSPSYPNQFLERNRIVGGLSIATVFIEVPSRSGALSTANHVSEQGRDALVFPGEYGDSHYAGSNKLLREGATLVTQPQDVLDAVREILRLYPQLELPQGAESSQSEFTFTPSLTFDDPVLTRIYMCLHSSGQSLTVDNVVEITKLQSHVVSEALTQLLLQGVVEESVGSFYAKEANN